MKFFESSLRFSHFIFWFIVSLLVFFFQVQYRNFFIMIHLSGYHSSKSPFYNSCIFPFFISSTQHSASSFFDISVAIPLVQLLCISSSTSDWLTPFVMKCRYRSRHSCTAINVSSIQIWCYLLILGILANAKRYYEKHLLKEWYFVTINSHWEFRKRWYNYLPFQIFRTIFI